MLIATHEITPNTSLDDAANLQVYCGIDSMVTHEVREAQRDFGPPNAFYKFNLALQAPYLACMRRGFLIDQLSRQQACAELRTRIARLQTLLNDFARAVWDRDLNPRSNSQLKSFFYEHLRLPEQHRYDPKTHQRVVSCNREALENLEVYIYARPIIACILGIRDLSKQLEVFETEIDPDGRIRTSYNIAGTETGRPSSSSNAFGTGGNLQNIAPSLRYVFIADPGMKLCQIDAEQSEARDVGWLCGITLGDWSYLDACELGDLHTNNASRIWRELPWTGNPEDDRRIADETFYRDFTYRDMAKRGSHLSNYMGTAWTASRALKVPQSIMDQFQQRYILGPSAAFPCIPRWWQWVISEIQLRSALTTPFGFTRHFFGRASAPETWREAIAFMPQHMTAVRTNLGWWRVWRYMRHRVELLAQTYDSITFQYPEALEDEIVSEAISHMLVEMPIVNSRRYIVPVEAKVGWNWGYAVEPNASGRRLNPDGLKKWSARGDKRHRTALPGQFGTRILT